MRQMQIQILGSGSGFWPRNEMGSSECVPLSAPVLRPTSKDSRSEKMPITVEDIVSTLRTGVYLGGAQHVAVRPCHVRDPPILKVISDTEYPPLFPSEKRSLLIKVDPGNPTALTATHIKTRDPTDDWPALE